MRSLGPSRSLLGESPLWSPDRQELHWLDLRDPALHTWSTERGELSVALELEGPLGPLVATTTSGVAVTTDMTGLHALDLATGRTRALGDFSSREEGVHANDGKIDREGRLWVATADDEEAEPIGGLHLLAASDIRIVGTRTAGGYAISNGPAFALDGSEVYFDDTDRRRVLAFPTTGGRTLGEPRLVHEFTEDEGHPDGLTVDAEGHLWVALFGGGRVVRLTPQGDIERSFEVPAPNVTSLTFGGDHYETLFITTARKGMSEDELAAHPGAGGTYAVEPGVDGVPEKPWVHAV